MHEAKNASKTTVWLAAIAAGTMLVAAVAATSAINVSTRMEKAHAVERTLKIDGHGEVTLNPDSLRTRLSVTAREQSLEEARTKVASKTRAIVKAIGDLGIAGLKIRTVDISITPITENTDDNVVTPPAIIGYEARSALSVALTNVSVADLRARGTQIIETALSAGANVIGGVTFFLNEPREARRMALAAAVEDAQKNGDIMAAKAGIKLVGLRTLAGEQESYYGGKSLVQSVMLNVAESEAPAVSGFPVEPGDIVVSADVQADFAFKQ